MIDWLGSYPGKYETGIYLIGDFYIGKGDVRNRVFGHFRSSIQGRHYNKALQSAILDRLASGQSIGLEIVSLVNTCAEERKYIRQYSGLLNLCNIN